jgi:hypothetical protein
MILLQHNTLSLKNTHPRLEEELSSRENHSDGSGRYSKAAARWGELEKGRSKMIV